VYSVVLAVLSLSQKLTGVKTNWRYANESEVARVIFVNKLDRMGADFYRVVGQVKKVLAASWPS